MKVIQGRRDHEEPVIRHRRMVERVEAKRLDVFDHGPHVVSDLGALKLDVGQVVGGLCHCCSTRVRGNHTAHNYQYSPQSDHRRASFLSHGPAPIRARHAAKQRRHHKRTLWLNPLALW
jgi:hypothetical protein